MLGAVKRHFRKLRNVGNNMTKEEEIESHKYVAERGLEFGYREITQGNDGYMQTGVVLRKIKQHPDKEHYVNIIVKNECEWNTKNQSI